MHMPLPPYSVSLALAVRVLCRLWIAPTHAGQALDLILASNPDVQRDFFIMAVHLA